MKYLISDDNLKKLQKAGYKIIGENKHSAVKLCLWTKRSIRTGEKEYCYKQKFYGIKSHECLQMTPSLPFCSLKCEFCWRNTSITYPKWAGKIDEPKDIINAAIEAQKGLLSGIGGVSHSKAHLEEAMKPSNAAISLAGEPTIYEKLPELINEFQKRKMTTFLVTNGTFPERLEALENLPTQLYVSLCSNSKEMFEKVQRPLVKDAWERLNKTLELFPDIKTRKVVRLTMVKDLNMLEPEKYAKLIEKALPNFVEVKSFMSVGFSRQRLPYSVMPTHEEIKEFAEKIANSIGYKVADEKRDSRVVLLKK